MFFVSCAVFFVPGLLLAFGGGFVFGLPIGTLSVWLGATIGQTVAFLLGRFLFQGWISSKAQNWKLWRAIEHVTNEQGWKIVALLRLAPVIPYDALNYAFGLTAIKFWEYFLASSISIIPGAFMFVYFGHVAGCIAKCASGDSHIDSKSGFKLAKIASLFPFNKLVAIKKHLRFLLVQSTE